MSGITRHAETAGSTRLQRCLSIWVVLAITISLAPMVAIGDDHNEARRLRESGQIMPLQEVLRRHRRAIGPRILDVELDNRRGRYVYQVESLDKRGKVKRHYFDATTGKRLGAKRN